MIIDIDEDLLSDLVKTLDELGYSELASEFNKQFDLYKSIDGIKKLSRVINLTTKEANLTKEEFIAVLSYHLAEEFIKMRMNLEHLIEAITYTYKSFEDYDLTPSD